jgi:competence protein ComEC
MTRSGPVWIAMCFALGIVAGLDYAGNIELVAVAFLLVVLSLLLYRVGSVVFRDLFLSASAAAIFFITGVFTGLSGISRPVDDVSRWTSSGVKFPVVLVGEIEDISFSADTVRAMILSPDTLCYRDTCISVSGGVYTGRWAPDSGLPGGFRSGSQVHLRGWLSGIEEVGNPGDFDRKAWLEYQGIHAVLEPFPGPPVLLSMPAPASFFTRLRGAIVSRIKAGHRDPEIISLLRAMLTGERDGLDRDTRLAFKSAGAAHLLAVSGLHVAIIAAVVFGIISALLSRSGLSYTRTRLFRAILTAVFVGLFAGVAGGSPSVVRGGIMAGAYITGKSFERRTSPWAVLALSGLIILAIQPLSLRSLGFQLSFGAVAAILIAQYGVGRLTGGMRSFIGSIGRSIYVTAFVLVLTGPILFLQSGSFAMMGLVSNPITIPVFGVFLVLGIGSTFLGPIGQGGDTTEIVGQFLLDIVEFFSRVAERYLTASSDMSLFPVLVIAVIVFILIRRKNRSLKRSALLSLAVFCVFMVLSISRSDTLKGVFLDVGQGDAALLRFPSGVTVLVDTGPGPYSGDVILRQVNRLGFSRLDLVVVSHFHRDHTGGLSRLASQIEIGRIVFPGGPGVSNETELKGASAGVRSLSAGDTVIVDNSAYIHVLAPRRRSTSSNVNESSLVLSIHYGNVSLLFLGDTEMKEENEIVADYGQLLSSNIIKIPHHGSRTSSNSSLVFRAVIPGRSWSVVSVGSGNAFGHPDEGVLNLWKSSGSRIWITSRSGPFSFETDGNRVWPNY